MATSPQIILDGIISTMGDGENLCVRQLKDTVGVLALLHEIDVTACHAYDRWLREFAKEKMAQAARMRNFSAVEGLNQAIEGLMEVCKQTDFDTYMLYMEWDRAPEKRFYQPRRHVLLPLVRDLQDLEDGRIRFLAYSTPPRVGKALADGTPVLTTSGWKRHGDLVTGDIVAAPDGTYRKVTHVHAPCEMQYEVEFTNGERIVCHGNHEWELYDRSSHTTRTFETSELAKRQLTSGDIGKRGGRYVFQLNHRAPLDREDIELPVAPYTLGAWLGDGRNTNPDICGPVDDFAVADGIMRDGYEMSWVTRHKDTGVMYYGFKSLRKPLQSIGMCHSRKRTAKHIPDVYLTASRRQRLALLAGLLDTDGSLTGKDHRYHFSTTEPQLFDGFVALVSTFGWRCSVTRYEPKVSTSGIHGKLPVYTVGFNPTEFIPCRLKRKQLHEYSKQRKIAVKAVRACEKGITGRCITVDGGMYCAGRTMIPTHNSTLGCFFVSWTMGRHPLSSNLMSGHSDKLTSSFHTEVYSLVASDEYRFDKVFPEAPFVGKNEKDEQIFLVKERRFASLTCRPIGGTLTGAVEAGNLLYCDDLVSDREEALNADRMTKLYEAYLNQLKDRKLDGAKELHIGTRWVPNDPIGLIESEYSDDLTFRFSSLPALDEDDESNFVYQYNLGFSTAYYHDMRRSLLAAGEDDSWWAKYMAAPFWREGRLFPENELQFYDSLPEGEPDAIAASADTKTKGPDYCVQVIAYVYGDMHYIQDVVCSDSVMDTITPILAARLVENKVDMVRYESNVAGGAVAKEVEDICKEMGYPIEVQTKYSTANKETRIEVDSGWIKKHCLFRIDDGRGEEYERFMKFLTSYSAKGRNPHDDVPDCLSMYKRFTQATAKTQAVPFEAPW